MKNQKYIINKKIKTNHYTAKFKKCFKWVYTWKNELNKNLNDV